MSQPVSHELDITLPRTRPEDMIVFVGIPGDPQALHAFTTQAIQMAHEGQWTSLTALIDHKILPTIREMIDKGAFSEKDTESIAQYMWETITKEIGTLKPSDTDQYTQVSRFVHGVFYRRLYTQYESLIYSYIYRRTSDSVLSENLTSDVFLKMLEAIHEDRYWSSSFSGWLYRIAHNLVIDYYRSRDRHNDISLDEAPCTPDPANNPVQAAILAFDSQYLQNALRSLTDEQSQVISLLYLEGNSLEETAAMMGKTAGAIKALRHRGLETLRHVFPR